MPDIATGASVRDGVATMESMRPPDETVRAPDGTPIAFSRSGSGPPLVLLHGSSGDHTSFRFVAPLLEDRFTVVVVDRRGRGASGDSPGAYRIDQEFADVAAIVDAIGGPVDVFGHSYGGTVALGAALLSSNLRRLVVYEADPGIPSLDDPIGARLEALDAAGDREGIVELVMTEFMGFRADELAAYRVSLVWPARVASAHTVLREIRAEGAWRPDPAAFAARALPALLLAGSESGGAERLGTQAVHDLLPGSTVVVLEGHGHGATLTAPEVVAAEVARFLMG
jgi:pimeloyl-ACP methyl ester carboxylesterase